MLFDLEFLCKSLVQECATKTVLVKSGQTACYKYFALFYVLMGFGKKLVCRNEMKAILQFYNKMRFSQLH